MTTDIDLVIPMVFPDDPVWQEEYRKCRGGKDATQHVRFRSWGTEELLVRCCLKYMPWVRCIHLLLAGESQVQGWMKELQTPPLPLPFLRPVGSKRPKAERMGGECLTDGQGAATPRPFEGRGRGGVELRIVFHREFVPQEYLPCFSSPCFEMFLHRIPGLSECFIYANDDMFPLSPLSPDDFFRVTDPTPAPPLDGRGAAAHRPADTVAMLPCVRFKEKARPANPNVFQRKCLAQLDMIGRPFGKHYKNTYLKPAHSFAPITKSMCEEVWQRHGDEIAMHLSPLTRTDRSYNHYIYMLQAYFEGKTVEHTPKEQYVGRNTPTSALAGIILDPQAGIVCLNDNEKMEDWEHRAAIVRREIELKIED